MEALGLLAQAVVVAAILLVAGFLASLTKMGDRLLGHWFERRIAAYRQGLDAEIEELRAKLARLGDRDVRTNEREYAALIGAWEHFIDAYRATQQCVMRIMEYPDLDRLPAESVAEFLATTEFSEPQRRQVQQAERKNTAYARIMRMRFINHAGLMIFDARSHLLKQSIFIPEEIEAAFRAAHDMLGGVQIQESMEFEHGPVRGAPDERQALFKDGERTLNNLKQRVRGRIGAAAL